MIVLMVVVVGFVKIRIYRLVVTFLFCFYVFFLGFLEVVKGGRIVVWSLIRIGMLMSRKKCSRW